MGLVDTLDMNAIKGTLE